MRVIPFLISSAITCTLIWALSKPWGAVPAMGAFLSPQQGFWQNAESKNSVVSETLSFPDLKDAADVYFDERLVPHVFAQNEADAFYIQGYLHAKFRLWQMEFQTHAAAGRLSEVLGAGPDNKILSYDRQMRRLGMVYGAEKARVEMEKNPATATACNSYTAGVNAYIKSLSISSLPLEYKLLGYQPEPWDNLKTALFLKYMSYDLAGGENDIEYTNAKSIFGKELFEQLYPINQDSLDPIVPKGTRFDTAGIAATIPAFADSLYFKWNEQANVSSAKPERDNGSNNWAVAGSKTKSGRPILCNDPHLSLNLPSLWYEMQISTPQFNAYGATFPGAPCVIIGFNDSAAFGFTNAMRDVRDYYKIQFKDEKKQEYFFNNAWTPSVIHIDTFKVKGKPVFYDTVAYTVFGPVMYDASYRGMTDKETDGGNYAVKWKAHEASNELMLFYKLDHAKNYQDYQEALTYLTCPGQNCLFATKTGDIAIWQQANFPAKWRRQGDFIMPGSDSTFMWQGDIPPSENAHLVNPLRGYVSSANQLPVDSTYPYYIGGRHDLYRGLIINRKLEGMQQITPLDMQQLQTDNYNVFAEKAVPLLLQYIDSGRLDSDAFRYADMVKNWNRINSPDEKAVSVFNTWFDSLEAVVWSDEFEKVPQPYDLPEEYTLIEALIRDSSFVFVDNIKTPQKETLKDMVTKALLHAISPLKKAESENKLQWSAFKDAGLQHLLKLPSLSLFHLTTGGGTHVINATKKFHGPSWRMIVHLTDRTEAYGIYPGGQSGNPGSYYYDNFGKDWAAGKYYSLWMMRKEEVKDKRIIATLQFKPTRKA